MAPEVLVFVYAGSAVSRQQCSALFTPKKDKMADWIIVMQKNMLSLINCQETYGYLTC